MVTTTATASAEQEGARQLVCNVTPWGARAEDPGELDCLQ